MVTTTTEPITASRRRIAAITGLAILLMAPLGMFGNLVVLGLGTEIAGMAERVHDAETPIHLAAVALVTVAILDVIAAWGLTRHFGKGDDGPARLAGWLRTAYAAVLAAATGQLVVATTLAESQVADDVVVAAGIVGFTATWQLGMVIFAAHLAVLAALVIRDSAAPTVLGWVIAVAATAYAVDSIARLFLPAESPLLAAVVVIIAVTAVVGEVGLAVWLLIRGGRSR